jgi:hypothetical protein
MVCGEESTAEWRGNPREECRVITQPDLDGTTSAVFGAATLQQNTRACHLRQKAGAAALQPLIWPRGERETLVVVAMALGKRRSRT